MKFFLIILSFIPGFTNAEIVTNFAATSNYVWRGQSQSNNDSAVQGTFEVNKKKLSVGTWLSSLGGQANGTEVDIYASYKLDLSDLFKLRIGFTNYTYTGNHSVDTLEYFLSFDYATLNIFIGGTGKYFGKETASAYYSLKKSFSSIIPEISVDLALGYTTFGNDIIAESKNIADYKVALSKNVDNFSYELFFTDTDRKTFINSKIKDVDDVAVGISISKTL